MALVFRDSEALEVVLRSGVCSPDVMARAAKVARGDGGSLILAPDKPLAGAALQKLRAAGVTVDGELPRDAHEVRCWAEAVPPVRAPVKDIPALVLFAAPAHAALVDLAAELVRLGCDRLELCPEHGLVRVVDPPTYSVVRALDHEGGLRVYTPDPAGQETIWTELGYRHPLATQLKLDPEHLLLISGNEQTPEARGPRPEAWRAVRPASWLPLDAALELRVPGDDRPLAPARLATRRTIELRLGAGRREAPSLWVIRQDAIAAVDKLLAYLPEEVVGRLAFAATEGDAPTIILRARTSRHAPPDLAFGAAPSAAPDGSMTRGAAEEYAPLAQMPDVFAPASAIVEPPLRRERLRSIIGVESGEVVWLARTSGDRFRVERTTDAAFAPLSEWADYVVHASAAALAPWMRATVFDFSPFVSTGLEWASERPTAALDEPEEATKKKSRGRTRVEAPAPAPALQTPRPQPQAQPSASTKLAGEVPVAAIPIDQELAALEAEFIALDAPGDAPERLALLERLGNVYARLGRRRDAGLCYARSVWESSGADATARLDAWIAAHAHAADPAAELERALAAKEPDSDDARLVAALAAAAHPSVRRDPHRVTRWLDDHDLDLDARTLWLARLGLASLSGGDPLGLAHARDRILSRLAGGLPVERELPAFLRFAGRSGALGNASGEHLGTALDELAQKLDKTRRKRSPVEAPAAYTNAYVGFLLAHGFARIGKHERARAIVEDARKALAPVIADPVHAYLSAAYTARVDQAIAGLPSETPLPEPLGTQLAALDRVTRYKVDRLREASRILEPLDRPDAIGNYSRQIVDSRGPEFAALRTLSDPTARANAIGKLITTATGNEQERERLLDGVFDVLIEVPVNLALPLLARACPIVGEVAAPRRAVLYAEALVVAGHFGNTELVPELLESLATALRAVTGADLERTLQHSLRALRRIGLRVETANLLARAEHALPQTRNIEGLRARLALAAGLAYLGEAERARPIFEQARGALNDNLKLPDRLELVRSLALAYAQMPLQAALGGIGELVAQFRDITDSYGTNSHYCLAVLHFVESLVLGITSDDLALGEAGRRFVEDDEHLIRRRLHLDLKGHK